MTIRQAHTDDLDRLTEVEGICFPEQEAAGKESFRKRLQYFAPHFLVLEDERSIIGFINGMVTDEKTIRDEMFEDASLHRENGSWQSIFGLDILPEYRCRGLAAELMRAFIEKARMEGRRGCILTCKKELLHYYEKFGYHNLGISASVHGGAVWFDMVLEFCDADKN